MQRAGETGGGRTYRGQMPVKWYMSLVLICVLGVALVVYSRYELGHPATAVQPAANSAHWYAALGFDVCGTPRTQPLPANPNLTGTNVPGIRTDGDGVIQIIPTSAKDAGNNATLARFVQTYPKLVLSSSKLGIPGSPTYTNGQTCPKGTPQAGAKGSVRIFVWSSFTGPGSSKAVTYTNPADIKLADGQLITVAFGKPGAAAVKPPTTAIEALLNDRSASATGSTTTPSTATSTPAATTTTAPGSTTTPTTTAPASSTTAPKSTTTTRAPSTSTTAK